MKFPRRLLGLLALLPMHASAQTPVPTPPPLPAESRQFDFWIGEWNVTNPAGKAVGQSRIESVAGQAALLENWTGAGGGDGKSLNTYNRAKKQWQQFWVGTGGGVLELAGGIVNGNRVLVGEHKTRAGQMTEKITWTPNPDGTVRQHWEQSTDGGKIWTDAFDGLYRKKQ